MEMEEMKWNGRAGDLQGLDIAVIEQPEICRQLWG